MHWTRWRQHGDPTYERPQIGFWDYVRVVNSDECWLWTGSTKGSGSQKYGGFYFRGSHWLAHRVSWTLAYGEIPEISDADSHGTCVLHKCDTPLCVNPGHLFLGTHKRNMEDKMAKKRDNWRNKPFCKHGHPRTPENLYTSKEGLRACRECHRIREAARQSQLRMSRHKEQPTF